MSRLDRTRAALCVAGLLATSVHALAQRPRTADPAPARIAPVFRAIAVASEGAVLEVDERQLRAARELAQPLRVDDFPLRQDLRVDLELHPFRLVGPQTRFVRGAADGHHIPFNYDWQRVTLLRGRVIGHPGSHVYLALNAGRSTGFIDVGPGHPRYRLSSRDSTGAPLPASQVSVFRATSTAGGPGPGIAHCGTAEHDHALTTPDRKSPTRAALGSIPSTLLLKHLELAIETDFELFQLFDDATAAMDYVVAMYGEVSAVYMRDVDTWIEVTWVRIWDQPDDLFNGPDPLGQFRTYWNENMDEVPRDTVQFFSGRRDFPYGGAAYLSSLCGSFGYGVVGYAAGFFPDPSIPNAYTWDIEVTAHELGHTCGAPHTHDLGIDSCNNPITVPQRGSIMAYCSQTWSGMLANGDLYFHRVIQESMDSHILSSSCIAADCNMNGTSDTSDIGFGASSDTNGNGVPDECEDCNDNGVLDTVDIGFGIPDLNGNGIPDSCEADCNNNGVPDDHDIALGSSDDLYGNDVPDECEPDCDENGTSDFTDIQSDMTLDKNRDAILDSCQDCDGDGPIDTAELAGAHDMWVASGIDGSVLRRFHSTVGVLMAPSSGASLSQAQDLIVVGTGSTLRVLVSSLNDARVMEFDADGLYQGDLVGGGPLGAPAGLVMTPDGDLLVANITGNNVLSYDGATGASNGPLVPAGAGGLSGPHGLALGPNGHLYVTADTNEVFEFDVLTGAFVRVLVTSTDNGGLDQPRGLAFKPDGNLLVASFGTEEVLEFDGSTGRPRGKWAQVGTATAITQDNPWGIRVGPNGHVYVTRTGDVGGSPAPQPPVGASHLTDARMFEYDVCTGQFRKTHIGGNDHGLNFATGFDFIDGFDIDCNQNQLQDDCDIASGFSADADENGTPDECQVDCNNNGLFDQRDLWPRGASMDCNCNFIPDECDIGTTSQDCNGNGIPDECEINFDCNDNGTQDLCEISSGVADDCDGNGILDECAAPGTTVYMQADFEGGLPAGWTTSGMFTVSSACAAEPVCDGTSWAYAGDPGSCTYDDSSAGGLSSPPIDVPVGNATLEFCHNLDTESGFDLADITANGVRVWRNSGSTGGWMDETINLSAFEGQTVTLVFSLHSDGSVDGPGWQIDDIRLVSVSERVGDEDADGVPDPCDACPGFDDTADADNDGIPDGCDSELCSAFADCADLNSDGIRDDNCVWWACVKGRCVGTDVIFGDIAGQFGACPPDGAADGNDAFAALNCFADTNADGSSPFSCEDDAPAAFNVDAGGQFGSCMPDGVCDGNDAFAALNAFSNISSCSCPLDGPAPTIGSGAPPAPAAHTDLALRASARTIAPGQVIDVDVYLDRAIADLRGYQLHIGVSGGKSGRLDLIDISTRVSNAAHVFADRAYWSAYNVDTAQMVAGLDTPGIAADRGAYLATYTFRASRDAAGRFAVQVLHDTSDVTQRTFLFPTLAQGGIVIERANGVMVHVGE